MTRYKIVTDMPLGMRDLLYSTEERAEEAFENARLDYVTGLDLLYDMDPYEYDPVEDDDWDWLYYIEEVEVDENDETVRALFDDDEDYDDDDDADG